jgi:hypothetical protein
MGAAARRIGEDKFDIQKNATRIAAILAELPGNPRNGAGLHR